MKQDRIAELAAESKNTDRLEKFRQGLQELETLIDRQAAEPMPVETEEAVRFAVECIKRLDQMCHVPVLSDGYDFLVGKGGGIHALTAGDHQYEDTGLQVSMLGWQMIDQETNPDTASDWTKNWRWVRKGMPPPFDLVAVRYPSGEMHVDWAEPAYDVPDIIQLSCKYGEPQFWMPLDVFMQVAPTWAKKELEPVEPSCKEEYVRRRAAHFSNQKSGNTPTT